ncbi:hypothetical protein [Acidocella aminolytica]|uniref:hypothetical protein n=1 Tax=Acidocella aminolytica TaxID=33998 RepID=UPI0018F1C2C4|nr:hypothetical protein [Acidocella aminolytica]
MAALVARILTNGFRDVFPFLAAMWIAEAIWLTVTFLGLSALGTQLRHFLYYPQICGLGLSSVSGLAHVARPRRGAG